MTPRRLWHRLGRIVRKKVLCFRFLGWTTKIQLYSVLVSHQRGNPYITYIIPNNNNIRKITVTFIGAVDQPNHGEACQSVWKYRGNLCITNKKSVKYIIGIERLKFLTRAESRVDANPLCSFWLLAFDFPPAESVSWLHGHEHRSDLRHHGRLNGLTERHMIN